MKRKPLARFGRRAQRERDALQAFREAVLGRAGGSCERCGERRELHAHHMARNPRVHDPALGAALCFLCHRTCHDDPAAHPDWFKDPPRKKWGYVVGSEGVDNTQETT